MKEKSTERARARAAAAAAEGMPRVSAHASLKSRKSPARGGRSREWKKEGSGGQPVRGRKRRETRTFRSSFLRSLLLRPCAAATSLPLYLSHCSPFLLPSAPLARSFVSFLSVSLSCSHCFHFSSRPLSIVPSISSPLPNILHSLIFSLDSPFRSSLDVSSFHSLLLAISNPLPPLSRRLFLLRLHAFLRTLSASVAAVPRGNGFVACPIRRARVNRPVIRKRRKRPLVAE